MDQSVSTGRKANSALTERVRAIGPAPPTVEDVERWFDSGWYAAIGDWAHRTTWIQQPFLLFSKYGIVLLALAGVVVFWRVRHHGIEAMVTAAWIPLAMVTAPGLGLVIKRIVAEPRPCRSLPDIPTLVPCDAPTDFSFPSNHAAICAAFAVAVFLLNRRWGLVAGVFALLMALSRVVIGVHYPHDVVAGLLLGGLAGLLGIPVRTLVNQVQRRREAAR
jgi:membrane-associated phospholipid phosphatase